MLKLDNETAVFFRDQLREARARVLASAEDFDAVVQVLERLGRFLCRGKGSGLGSFTTQLLALAESSPLANDISRVQPDHHSKVSALLDSIRTARNMAVHEGARARNLAAQCVECALIFEDALQAELAIVGDFMVRSPVAAAEWHPLSFVRQSMLSGSFSYLPVKIEDAQDGAWRVVSDVSLARALRAADMENSRSVRLGMSLRDAVLEGSLKLDVPQVVLIDTPVSDVARELGPLPILVVGKNKSDLVGILTAFDLV